ncbi:MAG: response regulator, partial [Victivallales bacterium]|nr:response regulator [Victivallales bacterium]
EESMSPPSWHARLSRECHGKTVLYIEDNPLIASGIRTWLESVGFTVLFADNGRHGKALFEANHHRIDAIIQDYILPGIKGDELLSFFVAKRPDLPVIIVSAENDIECVNRLLTIGARELIRKPFKMDELFGCLARVLQVQTEPDAVRTEATSG